MKENLASVMSGEECPVGRGGAHELDPQNLSKE